MRRLLQFFWQHVRLVIFTLAAFLGGVLIGLLFGRFPADWVEAVGTWFGAFAALFAVILAMIAFRSDEFARRIEQAQASRDFLEAVGCELATS